MDKIEEISEKFIDFGYRRIDSKISQEDLRKNKTDILCQIINILGDSKKAEEVYEESTNRLYDAIPDIMFVKDDFSIHIHKKDNSIGIYSYGKEEEIGKDISIKEQLPFKTISIDDFHNLFIKNGFSVYFILGSGSN